MIAFRNNLTKGDPVMHSETKRPGKVASQPRESSRGAMVLWQGATSPQHCDILKLRLVVDGKPEDVAPCDGEPPKDQVVVKPIPPDNSPETHRLFALDCVQRERAKVKEEMAGLERQFKQLRAAEERLAEAEKALTTP